MVCPSRTSPRGIEIHLSTVLGNTQIISWDFALLQGKLAKTGVNSHGGGSEQVFEASLRQQQEHQWDYIIQEKKHDFIAEWDLNSATCKVWGMARSPLGSVVAVVISLEPDDSLQYVTHSKEKSTLVFGIHMEGRDLVKQVFGGSKLPTGKSLCFHLLIYDNDSNSPI